MKELLAPFAFLGAVLDWAARVILIVAATLIAVQAADRAPPFEVVDYVVPAGAPGETVTFRAKVRRDIDRGCSVTMSRSFFDSSQARWDIDHVQFSPAFIEGMERTTPGHMAPTLTIPDAAAPGVGELVSNLDYVCNRVQSWGWPIHVVTRMRVQVLPPEKGNGPAG
jgi:hypothetical protein